MNARFALDSPPPAERWGGVGGGGCFLERMRAAHPGALRAPTLPTAREGSRGEGKKP